MDSNIRYDPAKQKRRWLGYFDLLGTRDRIESGNQLLIFNVFAKAIEEARKETGDAINISYACFSDTFIFYGETDSGQDFVEIESVARWFVYNLIIADIPVRGALTCGDFYADQEHSLYFGKALIEAHDYGEAPDCIGFLLGPSAILRLDNLGLPASKRLNYAYGTMPFKKGKGQGLISDLPACILGRWIILNGRNLCVDALIKMKERLVDQAHLAKYDNAIKFINKNRRLPASKQSLPNG